jgi:hypothetical protein
VTERESLFWAAIESLSSQRYVVVKQSGPIQCPPVGGDIDLFCESAIDCAQSLLSLTRRALESGFEIDVDCLADSSQIHVDFLNAGSIQFRFDCYGRLPPFKRVKMKDEYFAQVLSDRVFVQMELAARTVAVPVQCAEDESILRYLEYHEYFPSRPDKLKHLNWVIESAGDEASRVRFLKRLHWFTELPAWNSEAVPPKDSNRQSGPRPTLLRRAYRSLRARLAPAWRAIRSVSR